MRDSLEVQCGHCDSNKEVKPTANGNPRTPRGWRRWDDTLVCGNCWQQRFVLQSTSLPVVTPVDREWPELREALHTCWKVSAELSNWAVSELAKNDVVRTRDMKKLPPMPSIYLYQLAKDRFWRWDEMDTKAAATILRHVEDEYRRKRFDVIWRCAGHHSTYNYPGRYLIPNQAWEPSWDDDGRPIINVRIGKERWNLRLGGGTQYRRQLAVFRQLIDGGAKQGELSIYRTKGNLGDHRNGISQRANSGGAKSHYRIKCCMSVWLPKPEATDRTGCLTVRTDKESMLVALNTKRERLWIYNADHVPRIIAARDRRLRRFAEDRKPEKQTPKRESISFADHRQTVSRKYRLRLDSVCHEIAASLAKYANRGRFAQVKYDDKCHAFCERFPWDDLKRRIREKLEANNIQFVVETEQSKAA